MGAKIVAGEIWTGPMAIVCGKRIGADMGLFYLLQLLYFAIKPRNERAFLTEILHQDSFLKAVTDGRGARALNNVLYSLRTAVP